MTLTEASEDTVKDEVKDTVKNEVKEVPVAVDASSLSVQHSIREVFNVTQDHLLLKVGVHVSSGNCLYMKHIQYLM